jgi:hypothetical protein
MSEDKYYIPSIEEIRIGYQFEFYSILNPPERG